MREKFYEKFYNKSDSELDEIIQNENRYQKKAVDLAKNILYNRKNNKDEKLNDPDENSQNFNKKIDTNKPNDLPNDIKAVKLSYKKKSLALFIEYYVFSLLFLLVFWIFDYGFFSIYFICFFTYYSISELIFKRTLIMYVFGIELVNLEGISLKFIIYSITSILDRTIFAPFHLLLALLNFNKLLLCEKLSGIRWNTRKKTFYNTRL